MPDRAGQTAEKTDLIFIRTFDAPLELVWKAWVDPDLVKRWWGPDGFTAPLAKMDFREGGTSLVCMRSPQFGDQFSSWHYVKIVPMERIEYVHNLVDQDGHKIDPASVGLSPDFPQDLRNAVTFKPVGPDETEMRVVEYGWTVGRMMELSRLGMEQCMEKMAVIFSGAHTARGR